MIKTYLTCLALVTAVSAATVVQGSQRIPVSAAMAQCQEQKKWDSSVVMDGAADATRSDRSSQRYRACVYGKSGQYPTTKRTSGISISGSARFGIVYQE